MGSNKKLLILWFDGYYFFGIPWMELKNSKVLPKTLTVIGLPKNNEMVV